MSQVTATAFDQAGAHDDPFASTRANYERFAFLLLRTGRIPGLALSHLDFRLLIFLLGQKPGHYAAHHRTMAAACESNTTSIRQSLGRLRGAGVVLWELIPPHHALPSGRFTRTNVNRYRVHLPRLAALLDAPSSPATLRKSHASTRPKSDASYGTDDPNEQKPPPPTPRPKVSRLSAHPIPEEEAVSPIDLGTEIQPIREEWEKLGLGSLDERSARALKNRIHEGATLEQLQAAVAGAGIDEWLRRRAKVPFAVVFASLASIERFAHEGRKLLDRCPLKSTIHPQTGREERAGPWQPDPRSDDEPPTADKLRLLLPDIALGSPAPNAPVDHSKKRLTGHPELATLVASVSNSRTLQPDMGGQETPQTRREWAQAEFDRKRHELVAALLSLEE